MSSVKNKLGDINERITSDFSAEIAGLVRIMKDCSLNEDYAQGLADNIQSKFLNLQALAMRLSDRLPDAETGTGERVAVTGILAMATLITGPVGDIILFVLPTIIGPIISYFQKQKQRQVLHDKFLTEVFPEIKRKLCTALSEYVDAQIEQMIIQVRDQYEEQITQQRTEINHAITLKKADSENIQNTISELEILRNAIQEFLNRIIAA
jgi:hypothetical protein